MKKRRKERQVGSAIRLYRVRPTNGSIAQGLKPRSSRAGARAQHRTSVLEGCSISIRLIAPECSPHTRMIIGVSWSRYRSLCLSSSASKLSQILQEEKNSTPRLPAIDGQAKRINMNDLPMPTPGANALHSREETETMIFDKNIDIPLRDGLGLLRGNLYRPIAPGRYPVLVTCEFF
jgi:hypothetical protein